MEIKLKRVYEKYDKNDWYRILVDRLWPRGLKKEDLKIDLWLKDIAPSNDLRKWFWHKEDNWEEFSEKYKKELDKKKEILNQIRVLEKSNKIITFLYWAKDKIHNQAVVLKNYLT